ncbi:MAG TPA: TraR/DksA C4-type zinc finger protein [Pyrinomonadaceae bacterium]|nr:TraR/DksA C4-type zinc finger protein [Pyrinomonadaceae bacterium]
MDEKRTIHLVEIPIGGKGGLIWNRLHGEREDICEILLKNSDPIAGELRDLLQIRLRTIDDALDRLMSGSYGICSECGREIEESRLERDPAVALCLDCWGKESQTSSTAETNTTSGVDLKSTHAFDTILLRTHNSEYRFLLLDPATGRALVEGGQDLIEPSEALIKGSAMPGSSFKSGSICLGGRLEMWIKETAVITSPIKSLQVKHSAAPASVETISEALH